MRVRQAALLTVVGALLIGTLIVLGVFMSVRSGGSFFDEGGHPYTTGGCPLLMGTIFLMLTGLSAWWLALIGTAPEETEP